MKKCLTLMACVAALAAPSHAKDEDKAGKDIQLKAQSLVGTWCSGYNTEIYGSAEFVVTQGLMHNHFVGTYEWLGNSVYDKRDAFKVERVEGRINRDGYILFAANERISYSLLYMVGVQEMLFGFGSNSRTERQWRIILVRDPAVCEHGRGY